MIPHIPVVWNQAGGNGEVCTGLVEFPTGEMPMGTVPVKDATEWIYCNRLGKPLYRFTHQPHVSKRKAALHQQVYLIRVFFELFVDCLYFFRQFDVRSLRIGYLMFFENHVVSFLLCIMSAVRPSSFSDHVQQPARRNPTKAYHAHKFVPSNSLPFLSLPGTDRVAQFRNNTLQTYDHRAFQLF